MKITDIKQQVKRQGRYSIYVDGTFAFGLSELALINSGIRIGLELTAEELDNLKQDAHIDKAYNLALGQVARRPRSEWEMRDYLRRKDYDPELITQLVKRLFDAGFLDDHDFARRWVETRRLLRQTSKRRLQQELRAKRVSDDVITNVLAEDQTDESAVLRAVIEKKRTQSRYQDNEKLMAYLLRQGYNYEDIKNVLN